MGPHLGVEVGLTHQGGRCGATGDDDLHPLRPVAEGAHHVLQIQQAEIQHGIELVQNHHRVEGTGDRALGDHPAPLGFVAVEPRGFISGEVIGPSGAQVVDQMGEALLQSFDGRILVVGPAWAFEKAQQQHPGLPLLADAEADGAQHNPKSCLAFALALAVIDVQLSMAALAAVRCGDDADASRHGDSSYRWSLPSSTGFPR